ncbi:hypothetical protein CRYUN_Cryun08bG0106000 [Craigia yunnanensis]
MGPFHIALILTRITWISSMCITASESDHVGNANPEALTKMQGIRKYSSCPHLTIELKETVSEIYCQFLTCSITPNLCPSSKLLVQTIVICSSLIQLQCLNFRYPSFSTADANDFVRLNSSIINNVIQVSPVITVASGRILPQTTPGSERLAFILTDNTTLTKQQCGKSDSEDVDDDHVRIYVKNIYSIKQEPLAVHGSTGEFTEVNALKYWNFTSSEIRVKGAVNLLWLWILIPIVVIILVGGFSYLLYRRRKNRMKQKGDDELEIEQEIQRSSPAPQKFRLKERKAAAGNFNVNNKLGIGGLGTVYKGILRKEEVAVKRILKNTRHGKQDFVAEVTTISNLHHKKLVKLLGWCYESNDLLVYEFMPNGSLDRFIFRNTIPSNVDTTLNWKQGTMPFVE